MLVLLFFTIWHGRQKMLKTSTMISYIQRDEMQHAYFISQFIRILLTENPEMNTEENIDYIYHSSIKRSNWKKNGLILF